MKKYGVLILSAVLIIGILIAEKIERRVSPEETDPYAVTRPQQHIEALKNGADPLLGSTVIPADHIVDGSFESHLPLVVIDIRDQQIPVTKSFEKVSEESDEVRIIRTGEEPYVNGEISVIDNENCDNCLSDEPVTSSNIRIRYRGNSSMDYAKKQYAIKMVDESGENKKVDVMGMGENNDWILNISMIDQSLIRNYMAYNLGSSMFPYTPDLKYCEVFFKTSQGYEYEGLYLMMEKVEEGDDRVKLKSYTPGDKYTSYLLCRDREDENDVQLDTYGNQSGLTYGRLSVLYPTEDILDENALNYIGSDIDRIDRILYSEDEKVFNTWSEYLDMDSFVNYFVFNELMGNYDAGNNSTYMYKDNRGKLFIGPLWDYDGAMDNYATVLDNPENINFIYASYYDRLIRSDAFVKTSQARYKEMSSSSFSSEEISKYIDDVAAFLGNSALRDWSRWGDYYGKNSMMAGLPDEEGYTVDRSRNDWTGEVQRLKDFFAVKELYMTGGLRDLEKYVIDMKTVNGSYGAICMLALLTCLIVLIGRRKMIR